MDEPMRMIIGAFTENVRKSDVLQIGKLPEIMARYQQLLGSKGCNQWPQAQLKATH